MSRSFMLLCAHVVLLTLGILGPPFPRAVAAPAPFPRPAASLPVPLTRHALVGDWVMYWGDMRVLVTLTESGRYTCQWGTLKYYGSWGLDWEGRFWITESSQPQEARAWQSYAIRLKPGTLTGKIEVGAPGLAFRLEKRRPESKVASAKKAVLTTAVGAPR